ncbi:MAG: alpha/beta hydrolase family protein [Planctomycetota bacterium]
MSPLDTAPSILHKRLLRETTQALAYEGGDVYAWQKRLRRKLKQLIGWRTPPRSSLNVRLLWQRPHELGTIEKIAFTSESKCDVPAYVCIPAGVAPPYSCIVCLQGHTTGMHNSIGVAAKDERTPIEVDGDRDFALGCMRRGVVALCIEQRSFGQRGETVQAQRAEHMCHDAAMQAIMLGTTLIAERVMDVDRGLDYLAARGDIDMRTVGVMGNSGGGTITMYAAAVLPRLRFAVPSCAFCSFADSIMSIYHCADNYVPGLLRWAEVADVMGLFAPRPVVIVAGRDDEIFPLPGVRKEVRRLRRIYDAFEARRRVHFVVGDGGHRFYADAAWPHILRELRGLRRRRCKGAPG